MQEQPQTFLKAHPKDLGNPNCPLQPLLPLTLTLFFHPQEPEAAPTQCGHFGEIAKLLRSRSS